MGKTIHPAAGKKRPNKTAVAQPPKQATPTVQRIDNPDDLVTRVSKGLVRFERTKRRRRLVRRFTFVVLLGVSVGFVVNWAARSITSFPVFRQLQQLVWPASERD